MVSKSRIWKYSRWDAVLAAIPVLQFVSLVAWAMSFSGMAWGWNLVILPLEALVFYYNPIVVVHNFLHCPFFRSGALDRAYAAFNSINLGLPQVLYKYHHILHHQFSNDPVAGGTTRDPSSTFRFGKGGRQEHWAAYSALGLFRDATEHAFRETLRRGDLAQLVLESVFVVAGLALWIAIDWKWLVMAYLPMFYFGWFLAHIENYFEHHRAADPSNRYANSVSFYHPFYNRVMFNEGYHQEHHLAPAKHWTERPAIHAKHHERMVTAGAYVAKYPPLLGFLD